MEALKKYIIIGFKEGVKYYYLSSSNSWTVRFSKITKEDLSYEKLDIDMSLYPQMDPEYSHETVTLEIN
ncbi:MAG: hypothetical protein M0R03_22960 [Novosphingobium sp.]|nr:hypothetical protein [Novosphingobium sp.]